MEHSAHPRRRTVLKAALTTAMTVGVPLTGLLTATPSQAALPPRGLTSRYTMTAFTYSGGATMHVYEAPDGTGFQPVASPAYAPPSGLLRDPSIMRHTDGRYYTTYTTAWTGNQIGLASSADRITWTHLGTITLAPAGIGNSWAPEWFLDTDGRVHIVLSLHHTASTDAGTFQPHMITATNSDLTAWTEPIPLAGIPTDYIDTFVVKIDGTYHAVLKSTRNMSTDFATAPALAGPWTVWSTGNFIDLDNEGPCLVPLDNGGWRLYFEQYRARRFWCTDSYDTFRTWSTPMELSGISGTVKHLTVLKERVPGGTTLPAAPHHLGAVNQPNRCWAPGGSSALDLADSGGIALTAVPGLADRNGYSLRAADGRYVRHYAYRLRLDANNGTAVFARDATFTARPGSASGSVALESFSHPGRYVRHRDHQLWLDPYQTGDLYAADRSFLLMRTHPA